MMYDSDEEDIFEMEDTVEENPFTFPVGHSPTVQKGLCLSATSTLQVDVSSDEEDVLAELQCACRAKISVTGFPTHTHSVTDDYGVSHEIIGEGESGKVMACYSDKGKFALKVLRDSQKARREVELHYLTSSHENIVSILDIYENTFEGVKCLLIVVEFMEGGDLLTQFENQGSRPYSEKKVGHIMSQIGSAVQFLHDLNIAHRDIKLENILCSSTDEHNCVYKLADFGFAKRPERNTLMESPCCTPYYAPPEVIGRERYDKSCDMWSLGVAMYILLCGYPPFYSMKGRQLSPGMRSRISNGFYAFPHEEWDNVSDATKDDVRQLLKTNPAERMTIYELMKTSLIKGENYDVENVSKPVESEPIPIPRSARFLREGIKAPRLHSIQEEVAKVWEMADGRGKCNALLARRRSATNAGQPSIPC